MWDSPGGSKAHQGGGGRRTCRRRGGKRFGHAGTGARGLLRARYARLALSRTHQQHAGSNSQLVGLAATLPDHKALPVGRAGAVHVHAAPAVGSQPVEVAHAGALDGENLQGSRRFVFRCSFEKTVRDVRGGEEPPTRPRGSPGCWRWMCRPAAAQRRHWSCRPRPGTCGGWR